MTPLRLARTLFWTPGRVAALGLAAVAVLFAAANVHLLAVAFRSQPECVAPATSPEGAATYRAAKPSC